VCRWTDTDHWRGREPGRLREASPRGGAQSLSSNTQKLPPPLQHRPCVFVAAVSSCRTAGASGQAVLTRQCARDGRGTPVPKQSWVSWPRRAAVPCCQEHGVALKSSFPSASKEPAGVQGRCSAPVPPLRAVLTCCRLGWKGCLQPATRGVKSSPSPLQQSSPRVSPGTVRAGKGSDGSPTSHCCPALRGLEIHPGPPLGAARPPRPTPLHATPGHCNTQTVPAPCRAAWLELWASPPLGDVTTPHSSLDLTGT